MAKLIFNAVQGTILHDDDEFEFSYFNSVRDMASRSITLAQFVEMVKQPSQTIDKLRASDDKEVRERLKNSLPGVTVSGLFPNGRRESALEKHSRLLCMDFDAADNPDIVGHEEEWRDRLAEDKFVRVAFITASGHGLATITEISPMHHLRAFQALEVYFKNEYNLIADKACKDIPRFRFMSSDPNVRVNSNAYIFQRYSLIEDAAQELNFNAPTPSNVLPTTLPSVDTSIDRGSLVIPRTRKNEISSALEFISPDDRQTWIEVGMAIKSESSHLSAFNLWREWSMLNDTCNKFNEHDLARVWHSFGNRDGITIATLFQKARSKGWKNEQPVELAKSVPVVVASTYIQNDPPVRNFIVENLIEENDYVELIAPSKCRKTFFAIFLGFFYKII